jgi:hypothetical protein
VVEQFYRKQKFENDGTGSREDTQRVRINRCWCSALLACSASRMPAEPGHSRLFMYVLRKPDGSVNKTENFGDMAAEITRSAPFTVICMKGTWR